jgi:hypothetical protein
VVAISDACITRHTPLQQNWRPPPAVFRMAHPPSASSGTLSFPRLGEQQFTRALWWDAVATTWQAVFTE